MPTLRTAISYRDSFWLAAARMKAQFFRHPSIDDGIKARGRLVTGPTTWELPAPRLGFVATGRSRYDPERRYENLAVKNAVEC